MLFISYCIIHSLSLYYIALFIYLLLYYYIRRFTIYYFNYHEPELKIQCSPYVLKFFHQPQIINLFTVSEVQSTLYLWNKIQNFHSFIESLESIDNLREELSKRSTPSANRDRAWEILLRSTEQRLLRSKGTRAREGCKTIQTETQVSG